MEQQTIQVVEKNGRTALARGGVLGGVVTVLAMSNANAALTLDTASFITDIGTAETFGIAIGIALLGFVAVLALVKKSRGAVK
jgi:multisubunit Na+/H+ antiporter MnhF subunit